MSDLRNQPPLPEQPADAARARPGRVPVAAGALLNESAVYGVILVAGLVEIVAEEATSWEVLVKVVVTVLVFWTAHIFAGTVGHLSDDHDTDAPPMVRLVNAAGYAIGHSWGMLLAALIPGLPLILGVWGTLSDPHAIWASLWTAVAVLAVLGYLKVAVWSRRLSARLVGASLTAGLGLVLILLKALIH